MVVEFLLGRAGTGKTEACLAQVAAMLESQPADAIFDPQRPRPILLVPEQASLQMEATLISRLSRPGFTDGVVFSFTTLARRLLDEAGFAGEFVSDAMRQMALRVLLTRDAFRDLFGAAADSQGLLEQAEDALRTLSQQGIDAATLRRQAAAIEDEEARRRLTGLADLADAYKAWLGDIRNDRADELAFAAERIRDIDWLQNASIWVDGFAGFTATESQLLHMLIARAAQVRVTLLVDPDAAALHDARIALDPLAPFHSTLKTYRSLTGASAARGVEYSVKRLRERHRFAAAPALAALEQRFTGEDAEKESESLPATDASIHIRQCASHRDELRAAARDILAAVADRGSAATFGDFALVTRDLTERAPLVCEVLDEYEIPYFLDTRRTLSGHPLTRFVQALFDVVRYDLRADDTIALLQTDLTALTRTEVEALTHIIRTYAVRGSQRWAQRTNWDFGAEVGFGAPRRHARITDSQDSLSERRFELFVAFSHLLAPAAAGDSLTGAKWAVRIFDAISGLGGQKQIAEWIADAEAANDPEAAATHTAAWESLCAVLDALNTLFADDELPFGLVADIVHGALASQTFGVAPPQRDQVMVSAIERSRHPSIRHAFLFAFNEGVFPRALKTPGFLSWELRDALAAADLGQLSSRDEELGTEQLLAYIAMTRASHSLTISYATTTTAGRELPPSRLLAQVEHIAGTAGVVDIQAEVPQTIREFARGFLAGANSAENDAARWQHARHLLNDDEHFRLPLNQLFAGIDRDNIEAPVGDFRRRADQPADVLWHTSPKELQSRLRCPFQHFAGHGLRLATPQPPDDFQRTLGIVAHRIVEEVVRKAAAEARSVKELADDDWGGWFDETYAALQASFADDFHVRRGRLRLALDMMHDPLRACSLVIGARYRCGNFRPVGVEVKFGRDAANEDGRVEIEPDQFVVLHGAIDRVDVAEQLDGPVYLICDYKSTARWSDSKLLIGHPLQIFLYSWIDAAQPAEQGAFAGSVVLPLYPDMSVTKTKYFAQADDDEKRLFLYYPRGCIAADSIHAFDTNLEPGKKSPAAFIQINTKSKIAEPVFNQNSDVVSRAKLEELREAARGLLRRETEGVVAGTVEVSPLREDKTLACRQCEYLKLCRFERGRDRIRVAEDVLPQMDAAAEKRDRSRS